MSARYMFTHELQFRGLLSANYNIAYPHDPTRRCLDADYLSTSILHTYLFLLTLLNIWYRQSRHLNPEATVANRCVHFAVLKKDHLEKQYSMLCKVCKDGMGGIEKSKRLCLVEKHVADSEAVYQYWHQPSMSASWQSLLVTAILITLSVEHQPDLADFWYAYGHHRDEASFARSTEQMCVMCSDFPFHDDEGRQVNNVRKLGFFTIFWISYDNGRPCMTVDSGYGSKTVSLIRTRSKHKFFPRPDAHHET